MVSSVWTGSASASVLWSSGGSATNTVELLWRNPPVPPQGLTVSAQAALSGYSWSTEGGPTLPLGAGTAAIRSYRLATPGYPFVQVNAPTIDNIQDVFEVLFELTVTAFEGQSTEAGATMVGTVFIQ